MLALIQSYSTNLLLTIVLRNARKNTNASSSPGREMAPADPSLLALSEAGEDALERVRCQTRRTLDTGRAGTRTTAWAHMTRPYGRGCTAAAASPC